MDESSTASIRRLAQLAAISRITDNKEATREIVLKAVAVEESFRLKSSRDIQTAIDSYFGIKFELCDIEEAMEYLENGDRLRRGIGGWIVLGDEEQRERSNSITESKNLESNVIDEWKREILPIHKDKIDPKILEECLIDYLSESFLLHGIETVQILDTEYIINNNTNLNIAQTLSRICARLFDTTETASIAKECINSFFINTADHPNRRRYIAELADGAFMLYALNTPADVRNELHKELHKITFYLDTNYIWSVLGLHNNQYVNASKQIIEATKSSALPFSYKYLPTTERELLNSINTASKSISEKTYAQKTSETLRSSPHISGIERLFHEKNSKQKTDPSLFIKPYENISSIIQNKGITIDRTIINWDESINELFHEYKSFRESMGKEEKSYETIQHDATLLHHVRQLRNHTRSPLLAGTLLLTCDYTLYQFDIFNSRQHGIFPTAILPNVLLQILRPILPQSEDFERAFAETFLLPEFRSYSKKAAQASIKMAEILSAVDGLDPSISKQMLMDDILVGNVARAKSNDEVKNILDKDISDKITEITKQLKTTEQKLEAAIDDSKHNQRSLEAEINKHEEQLRITRDSNTQLETQLKQLTAEHNKLKSDTINKPPANPWKSGSFVLICLILATAIVFVFFSFLPWGKALIALPIICIILLVTSALQLKNDDKLKDEHFMRLIKLSLSFLTQILPARKTPSDNEC